MEKAVRKLMGNTIKLRNWTTLSNYIATHSLSLNSVDPLQDNLTCKELESNKENIEKFVTVDSYNDLPNTVKRIEPNYKNMNEKETIKMMSNFNISMKNNFYRNDIKNSAEFIRMCHLIHKNVKSLNTDRIIQALQILIYFNVHLNSTLAVSLLQLLKFSVNDLSVRQILKLHYLLRNQQSTPLINALLEGLPYVFRNQVRMEIDRRNMYTLLRALGYACDIHDVQTISYMIDILCPNRDGINIEYVTTILRALYMLPFLRKSSMLILSKTKEVIMNNYTFLKYKEINTILFFITHKCRAGKMQFYSEDVVNPLCKVVIHNNSDFIQSIKVLNKLNKIFHSNISLLDYIAEKCIKDMYVLQSCTSYDIYTFIRSFVIADYKPNQWQTIKPMLLQYIATTNYSTHYLITIVYRMMSLGCYCPQLLEKAFTLYYCAFDTLKKKGASWHILKLHQAVTYLYPQYNGIKLSQDMIDKLTSMTLHEEFYPLCEHVEEAVGDVNYVKPGLKTKLGDFVQHTIALQPNGSLMTINDYNNDVKFVEDLMLPPDCHKLLVFILPKTAYSINLQTVHSTWRLHLNLIEISTGCKTLPINPYLWNKVPIHGKSTYLQQAIKAKINEILSCTYS